MSLSLRRLIQKMPNFVSLGFLALDLFQILFLNQPIDPRIYWAFYLFDRWKNPQTLCTGKVEEKIVR